MKVLIACEESQTACIAFRERGHEAYSCDLQKCSGGHPEWHIQADCIPLLNGCVDFTTQDGVEHSLHDRWDLIIAHPPCTYLSNAGACRLFRKIDGRTYIDRERFEKGLVGKEFFLKCLNADCDRVVVENPVPSTVYQLPRRTQVIQPYEFGHPYSKRTYLWIRGLPELKPTNIVKPIGPYVCGNADIWKKQAKQGVVIGKEKSAKHRSKSFTGIAQAMSEQWG